MAKLSKDDVLHVAKLAKLTLSEKEIEVFTAQLSKVLDHFGELSEVDTTDTIPTSQTTGLEDVYRKDEIKTEGMLSAEDAVSGTDRTHNGYFKVKAILEGRTDK